MKILVLGGTRFVGKQLVRQLINKGYDVTIANRGNTVDEFGGSVNRIIIERKNADSIKKALSSYYYNVVYDFLAYTSTDVEILLDNLKCKRYIMISTSMVYKNHKIDVVESDFNPFTYEYGNIIAANYGENKRQAESYLFQKYKKINAIAIRFPYIIGIDDYTKRLFFYVEKIINQQKIYIDNLDEKIGFINSSEAAKFLLWIIDKEYIGPINACNQGTISLGDIIRYVEDRTEKKAFNTIDSEIAPYNGQVSFSLSTEKARDLGFSFTEIETWVYKLLDEYIELVSLQ